MNSVLFFPLKSSIPLPIHSIMSSLSLDTPLASSLDAMTIGDAPSVLTFITPKGRYTLAREATIYSPVLDLLASMYPDLTEYDLVKLLKIYDARDEIGDDGEVTKMPAHTLYNIPEEYYELVFTFFNLLHSDKGIIQGMPGVDKLKDLSGDEQLVVEAELREGLQTGRINPFPSHCTIFDPTSPNVLPQAYWGLVSKWATAESLKDIGSFDYVALNFGNYALSKLNELAGAFWISKNESKLASERKWIEHIIGRDVTIKIKERERNDAKHKLLEESKEAN